tara:strand:- start:9 stop:236 length:228 start_codon:yes stop_codon:yes gene_type:complete
MKYSFTLDKEQVKALIEMIEQHRCEGESQLCTDLRTSIKNQYKEQYRNEKDSITEDEFVEYAQTMLGPKRCDNCD